MKNKSYEYKGVTIYICKFGCFLFYSAKDKYGLLHGPWRRMNFRATDEAEQFIKKHLNTFYW